MQQDPSAHPPADAGVFSCPMRPAQVDIFLCTFCSPHDGQLTPSPVFPVRTSSSNIVLQLRHSNSYNGMLFPPVCIDRRTIVRVLVLYYYMFIL